MEILEAALEHLTASRSMPTQQRDVQYELGQTLRQSGDLAGAVAAFEKALEIEPEMREGYYGLGVALKQQSASAEAEPRRRRSPADDLYCAPRSPRSAAT